MKGKRLAVIALSAIMISVGAAGLAACGGSEKVEADIINGGFESNVDESTWLGWTRDGNAFSARSVVSESNYTESGVEKVAVVDKEGEKFFFGIGGGNSSRNVGTLTSNTFKLSGTGKIAFKMGGGKNGEKVYVEFVEAGGKTLAKVTNEDFNEPYVTTHMIRKIVDLSAHVGKNIYIKVTDEDNGRDFGYVNLDDFVMCATDADVAKYEEQRAAQLKKYGEPTFSETPTNTTIENGGFETGDLSNWKILSGTAFLPTNVVPTSQRYWNDRAVYGNGEYYLDGSNNGMTPESATGAIRSQKFTLAGDGYITFMMGAGKSNCFVSICAGESFTIGEGENARTVEEGDELIKVSNEYFRDPDLALTLLRRYVDASDYIGKVLYIKVEDKSVSGGFNFMTVDDFRVSLTQEEVSDLQVEQYRAVAEETYTSATYNDLAALKNFYDSYEYLVPLRVPVFTQFASNTFTAKSSEPVDLNDLLLANVSAKCGNEAVTDIAISKIVCGETEYTQGFDAFDLSKDGTYKVTYTATFAGMTTDATITLLVHSNVNEVANGGFETGDLTGWTVLTDGWAHASGQPNGVISAETYWDQQLPYNQSGSFHLDGWNTGIEEGGTWEVKSSNFTLGGSGWISVKMGGHAAAVKVYKADGTLIGYYKQSRFADVAYDNGFLAAGGSWADMAVYAIDLSAYLNEELYVVLCDETAAGWAHAFFDDVITYYETAPAWETLFDTVINAHRADEPRDESDTVNISWVLGNNELDAVVFTNPVQNAIVPVQTGYDFTAMLDGVTATYGAANIPVTNIAITKIVYGDVTLTDSFENVDLTEGTVYRVTYVGTYGEKSTSMTFTVIAHSSVNQIQNGGFETGDLTGWTIVSGDVDLKGGTSSADHNDWAEKLPYNKTGDFFCANAGLGEHAAWELKSSTFTLAGNGYISFKMASQNAILKVFKADGTQVYSYTCHTFSDTNFPHVEKGGNWCTLRTHYADLSAYLGEELYITIGNTGAGGAWEFGYFDEIVTYYEAGTEMTGRQDDVLLTCTNADHSHEAGETTKMDWILAGNEYTA